jgi:hypothetical protein
MHCSIMATDIPVWKWTRNLCCDACWQLTLLYFWMPVPTFKTFNMVWHDHTILHTALHGTPMQFCWKELIFSHTNAVPLYRLPFLNEVANATMFACKIHVHCCTYTPIWW